MLALHYINVLTLYLTPIYLAAVGTVLYFSWFPPQRDWVLLRYFIVQARAALRSRSLCPPAPPLLPPETAPPNRLRRVPRTGFARDAQLADGTANRIQSPSVDERGQALARRGLQAPHRVDARRRRRKGACARVAVGRRDGRVTRASRRNPRRPSSCASTSRRASRLSRPRPPSVSKPL